MLEILLIGNSLVEIDFWPDQETRYVTPYKQVDTIVDIVTCKLSRLK